MREMAAGGGGDRKVGGIVWWGIGYLREEGIW